MSVKGLNYSADWKFEGVGFEIPDAAVSKIFNLIIEIAGDSKENLEIFGSAFGNSGSSNYSWACTDLDSAMRHRAANAAAFVDCLWQGLEEAQIEGLKTPQLRYVNKILADFEVPLEIKPPDLLLKQDALIADQTGKNSQEGGNGFLRFKLEERIGGGGFGEVYRAIRSTSVSDFECAIKILDPSPFVENYDKALRRFQREVRAVQSLQHRAIVSCIEAGITPGNKPYLVMPLIKGEDLREAVVSNRKRILGYFIEILSALEYAHSNDVVHRDLKPNNIIVRLSDLQPVILDFGAAYTLDEMDSTSITTQLVGTLGYIPPEVLDNPKERSPLQDIFACGVMLYEAFAGIRPTPRDYRALSPGNRSFRQLDLVIKGALEVKRRRLTSAGEFRDKLSDLKLDEVL